MMSVMANEDRLVLVLTWLYLFCYLHQKCAEILFSVLIAKQMSKVMMIIRTCKICDHLARAKKNGDFRKSTVSGMYAVGASILDL